MINKQTIETQLDCKATASLSFEIVSDFAAADRSMSELLQDLEEKDNEFKDKPDTSS
jgi:hypothetical protein